MRSYTPPRKSLGDRFERGISSMLLSYMASICRWFQVKPHHLKRQGVRPNAPPPSGGISSLG